MTHPKLRALEPVPTDGDRFYLRDPMRLSESILLVPRPVLFLLSLMDGARSKEDLLAEFERATGQLLPTEQLDTMLATLDEALFLDNDRFAAVQARIVTEFHASETRPAIHAGLSYPQKPEELGELLGGHVRGAAPLDPSEAGDLEGIIAPHIDLGRGGECYGAIYRQVALNARARRFVILGISHHPLERVYALTAKDYETPLGTVRTDVELVQELASACHTDFLTDEIAHRDEHSVEFQMLFLQYLLGGNTELCSRREFTVVPILCGSIQEHVRAGQEPDQDSEVQELLGALGRLLGDRAEDCLVAAVDFAHLGRQFGQDLVVKDETVQDAAAADRRMMQTIVDRDATGFFNFIAAEQDGRNVCGVPAIYAMLRLIGPGRPGRIHHYGQAVDRASHNIVTFAGLGFPRAVS